MVVQAIVCQFPEGEMYSIQLQMTELEEPERDIGTQAHIQLQYTKHLANFKLLFLKVVFCTRVGLQQLEKYNSAMISASIFYFYFYQGNKIIWYIKIQTS